VEDNLLGGSKADDEIALPVVGHPYLWALLPDGHGTKADVHTVVISFDGFGVVTNDGVFSKENDPHFDPSLFPRLWPANFSEQSTQVCMKLSSLLLLASTKKPSAKHL